MLTTDEAAQLKHLIDLHTDRHHLKPKSRSPHPNNKQVIKVSRVAHLAWHILFGNALPHEAKLIIEKYWTYNAVQTDIELPDTCQHYYKRE